jgi:thiamine pyrophosphate-dependent acetolactate synthase large subunit-like protein
LPNASKLQKLLPLTKSLRGQNSLPIKTQSDCTAHEPDVLRQYLAVADDRSDTKEAPTLVAECLQRLGITHVYSVSGTPIDQVLPACAAQGIRPIGVHNQQAAVLMATAQNYVNGRLTAAVVLSAGPAVTNAVTGILVAHDNCWPVIVLGGRRPLYSQGMGYFQELNAVPIFRTITKWSATVPSTSAIPDYLQAAFRAAVSERPGPVYLDLPEDVLSSTIKKPSLESISRLVSDPLACDGGQIGRALRILLDAQRPALIIGKGVRWSVQVDSLRRFVERLGIPFITSPMGRGFLPDDHPLCCNSARRVLQSRADAVLIVGARLNWTFRYGAELAPEARTIHVDIHQEDLGRNRSLDVAIHGDAGQCISQLVQQLEDLGIPGGDQNQGERLKPWHQELAAERKRKQLQLENLAAADSIPMSPHRLVREIRDCIPSDAICITDGHVVMAAAQEGLPCSRPASRLDAGTNGCMGVGIPFAIGAKIAEPHRPVVCVCGDYAFSLSAMELETCVRHRIPIIVIVGNNHGLIGASKHKTYYPPDYPELVTMFQPGIRYETIVQTFGGHGEFVEHPGELRLAFERALQSGKPACINAFIDPHAPLTTGW